MIRINLAVSPKPKGKHGAATAAAVMEVGDAGSPLLKVLVVLVVLAAGLFLYWRYLDKQAKEITVQMQKAEENNRKLADVKARYQERKQQADAYQRRVNVIDDLRKSQTGGPVDLLNTIGDTINGTEAVWLSSMKDQGSNVAIEGMALSTDAVANLIANLQKSGFKNIEIKETYQDEQIKDMQAFQFTLTCEKGKS